MTFIFVVIFASLDFWTVKNITGRLLVGLRWWTDFLQDGREVWRFESYNTDHYKANIVDSSFFWASQLINTGVWAVLLFFNVMSLSFTWAFLNLMAVGLSAINLYGYHQCSKGTETDLFYTNVILFFKETQQQLKNLQRDVFSGGLTYIMKGAVNGFGTSTETKN